MKQRLAAALVALVAVTGLVLWGLYSATVGRHAPPAGSGASAHAAVSARPEAPRSPAALSKGRQLIFDARFSGSALDTSVWATCFPWMDVPTGCTSFAGREYQWYLPAQVRVFGGALHLVAQQIPTKGLSSDGAPKQYRCRSGMVTTYPGFRFEYGYLRVVARIPAGAGMWSALWLAAANRRWPPEIDVLERWGTRTGLYFHPVGPPFYQHARPATGNLSAGWHTFSLSWTRSRLVWFIDGHQDLSIHQRVPHQPMYFIANLAESRSPGTTWRCAGTLLIRSVKVWQF